MPDIVARLRADQITARKTADKDRTLVLGTVLASLKNREIELGHPVSDVEAVAVLRRQIKQRHDSVDQYRQGGRHDLAVREEFEIGVLQAYLPPEVDPDLIRTAAREAIAGGASDLGKLMAALMAQFKGQADGRTINQIAREALRLQ
ncbi:MAG: GatB/YqeY domain-containing protein [Gemmatimonadales bacterium]